MRLRDLYTDLKRGCLSTTLANRELINNQAKKIISIPLKEFTESDRAILELDVLLDILNIAYNNTDLDDDEQLVNNEVYDALIDRSVMSGYMPVGSEVIHFNDYHTKKEKEEVSLRNPLVLIDDYNVKDMLFKEELFKEDLRYGHFYSDDNSGLRPGIVFNVTGDGGRNTKHDHPHLVGTLSKCKFVTVSQAEIKRVLDDSNVKILERDFFNAHFQRGYLSGGRIIIGICSLKYDGISVDITLKTEKCYDGLRVIAINGTTRGDAINDLGKDVTHVIYGYHFYNADPTLFREEIGLKVEAVMTYGNLRKYNEERERNYKNPRSAISSIFNSNDGYKYMKYITLVPLELDIEKDTDESRLGEILFMNEQLTTGEFFRYAVIEGDFLSALFQIKKFVDEAEASRDLINIMYDGVVFEYTDVDLRNSLGRVGAVNQYAKAIKFNPLSVITTFRYYDYTVGVNGVITPMIYYDPIMFIGTTHDHSSGSSFERFTSLALKPGDKIRVEYVNEVMPYVYSLDCDHNRNNPEPLVKFIEYCPACHSPLYKSESGKSVKCINNKCIGRVKRKMANMVAKLGIVDIAEASMEKLPFTSFRDMIECTPEQLISLGEVNAAKFYEQILSLRNNLILDYEIMGSLGFTDIAKGTWRIILEHFTVYDLMNLSYDYEDDSTVFDRLLLIKGIGEKTVETIKEEIPIFSNDLMYISSMINIVQSKGMKDGRYKIRCTGFRDKQLIQKLISLGYDADDNASVTKEVKLLIINSSDDLAGRKAKNAIKYGINIRSKNEVLKELEETGNLKL